MKTCVIIGGGIGGLVTGALLAKGGYKVTVLEKNAIIGGGLQTFKRNGVGFPTGMHIFGGFQEGGNLHLHEAFGNGLSHSDDFLGSVNQLMDRYITNPKLKSLLGYLSPLVGGDFETTPAYIHALLSTLHIKGTFQYVDGHRNG